jgi:hypothetical protein
MCGTRFVEWPCFTQFLRLVSSRHFRLPREFALDQTQDHAQTFSIIRLGDWPRTSMNIAHAFDWSTSSLATDNSDKVFALLGLVTTGLGREIVPDYTYPPCVVYCIAIRAVFGDWKHKHPGVENRMLRRNLGDHDSVVEQFTSRLRKDMSTIPKVCVDAAPKCEKTESPLKPSRAWHRMQIATLSMLKTSSQHRSEMQSSGCDGQICGSQSVLWSAARWHKFPINHWSGSDISIYSTLEPYPDEDSIPSNPLTFFIPTREERIARLKNLECESAHTKRDKSTTLLKRTQRSVRRNHRKPVSTPQSIEKTIS